MLREQWKWEGPEEWVIKWHKIFYEKVNFQNKICTTGRLPNHSKYNLDFFDRVDHELLPRKRMSGPQPSGCQGLVSWKTVFPWTGWVDGFWIIQVHYIYCALYFYFYYISSTSDYQALDPRAKETLRFFLECFLTPNDRGFVLFCFVFWLGGVFSHINQFSSTHWVFNNSFLTLTIQNAPRPHRLRVQSYKTASPTDISYTWVPTLPTFLPSWLHIRGFPWAPPSPGSVTHRATYRTQEMALLTITGLLDFPGGSDGKESACSGEAWVWSLGWEDPLEKEMATHSSILSWRIPWSEGTWSAV